MKFSVDDRGNEAIFYKHFDDGSWERVAVLNRESGPPPCNQCAWQCDSSECEKWAMQYGYACEIMLAKATAMLDESSRRKLYEENK